jgi:hypothetical protein
MDGGSARRKAATCTQHNTNTEYTHTYINALSWIRTLDPSVRAGEDGSCLKLRGHCDQRSMNISGITIKNYVYLLVLMLRTRVTLMLAPSHAMLSVSYCKISE